MPNLDWNAPMTLKSSYGVVDLNTVYTDYGPKRGWYFLVTNDDNDYSIVPAKLRVTSDSASQGDGSSIQPGYIDGLVATMTVSYQYAPSGDPAEASPACPADVLREMNAYLMGVLNGLRTYPVDVSTQQYAWTPNGAPHNFILEGVMLGPSWPTPDFSKGPPEVRLKFQVSSPYPYALENDETVTSIAAGDSAVVTNPGNIEQQPVIFAIGPFTEFAAVNEASGLTMSYDSSRPGAHTVGSGDILQVNTIEGTVFLNGDPDLNYIAGMDPNASDFWGLLPNSPAAPNGDQTITVSGADIQVISFPAFV